MSNKIAIITGCSSGIGKATAKLLKNKGWKVFATARKKDDVQMLSDCGLESCQLDLEDSSSIHSALNYILSKTGNKLNALINNAGFGTLSAVEDLKREELRKQFEVNLFGLQELTNLVIPIFRKEGQGRIINIGSLAGRISIPYSGAYCASKFALEALSEALRMELLKTNIFVSLIEPGFVAGTNFNKNTLGVFNCKNIENSYHHKVYENIGFNLKKTKEQKEINCKNNCASSNYIANKILCVLESDKPHFRYFITKKTSILWLAVNFIPQSIKDIFMKRYFRNIL